MSRWLVGSSHEQEVAGLQQQQFGQRDPRLFAARQHGYGLEDIVAAEQKAAQRGAQVLLRFGRRGLPQFFEGGIVGVQQVEDMLRVIGGDHVVAEPALPVIDGQHAGEDFQQRRLAGAVGSNQRDAVPPLQRQVQSAIHHVVAV